MVLEADSVDQLVRGDDRRERTASTGLCPSVQDGARQIVFFKPVDSNLSRQTMLGSFKSDFDFMAQMFVVREWESEPSTGKLKTATVGSASGSPTAMSLSQLRYADLSSKLTVWEISDNGYFVAAKMPFGADSALNFRHIKNNN